MESGIPNASMYPQLGQLPLYDMARQLADKLAPTMQLDPRMSFMGGGTVQQHELPYSFVSPSLGIEASLPGKVTPWGSLEGTANFGLKSTPQYGGGAMGGIRYTW